MKTNHNTSFIAISRRTTEFGNTSRREWRRRRSSLFWLRIVEAESFAGWACYASCVVVEHVVQVLLVFWVRYAVGIGVWRSGVKRQWGYGVAVGGVEVHVFGESVGVEEIVAGPASRNIGQVRAVEICRDFVAGAEDYVFVVGFLHEVGYVAVAGVISDLAGVGTCGADVFVNVGEIVFRIGFDYAGVAAELQFGFGEGNVAEFEFSVFGGIIHADAIPIDAEICGDADEASSGRNFPREVGDHGAVQAGGEAHVVNHLDPLAGTILHFDVRWDGSDSGLPCGIHGAGAEIIGKAVHEQAEWVRGIPIAEVEFDPVHFGEA